MTDEEVMYRHFLEYNTKRREEAIEHLKNRDFKTLYNKYAHFFRKERKEIVLEYSMLNDVISELSKITIEPNESEPFLSCSEDNEITVVSYLYYIEPFKKCEYLAKAYATQSLFKLKHQPTGKEAQACRKILNSNKN